MAKKSKVKTKNLNKKSKVKGEFLGTVVEEDLFSFALRNMQVYSKTVNEERSVPDLFDGLKPVARRILWSSYQLFSQTTTQVKTAKLTGHCSGSYHPHGTVSIAGAVATMVNSDCPPLYGVGNWGSLVDPPAAERYTELRVSAYGRSFLNRDYLAVANFIPNYDGTSVEPLSLPALLPSVFMNSTSGIGVGLTTDIPAFNPSQLLKVCSMILDGEVPDSKWLAKNLSLYYSWGGRPVKTPANLAALKSFFETGQGTVQWETVFEEDRDKKLIFVKKFAPQLNLESLISKINLIPQVDKVYSAKGLSFVVRIKRSVNFTEFDAIKEKIRSLAITKVSYRINVTMRTPLENGKYNVSFLRESFVELLIRWLKYRVSLEKRYLTLKVQNQQKDVAHTELLIKATDALDIIFKALRSEDPAKNISKGMKITLDEANTILELKVKQLTKLDQEKLKLKLKEQLKELKILQAKLKAPAKTVNEWFKTIKFEENDERWKNQHQFYLKM